MLAGAWGSSIAPLPAGWAAGQLAVLIEVVPAFAFQLPSAPDGWTPQAATPVSQVAGIAWTWLRVSRRVLATGDTAPPAPADTQGWSGRILVDQGGAPSIRVTTGAARVSIREGGSGAVVGITGQPTDPAGSGVSWLSGRAVINPTSWWGPSLYVSVGTTDEGTAGSASVPGLGIEFLPPVGPRSPNLLAPAAGDEINASATTDWVWQHVAARAGGRQGGWSWRITSPTGWLYWSVATGSLTATPTVNPGADSSFQLPPGALSNLGTPRSWTVQTIEALDGLVSPWAPERTVTPVAPPSLTVTVSSPPGDLSPTITGVPVITRPSSTVIASQWQVRDTGGTVIWDSGVIGGATVIHNVPANLPWVNGASYTAWGRVQQTGGAWSAWTSSAPFVVTWTPPATPVVVAVPVPGGAQVTITELAAGADYTLWSSTDDGLTWSYVHSGVAPTSGIVKLVDPLVIRGPMRWSVIQYVDMDGVHLPSERGVSDAITPTSDEVVIASALAPATTWLTGCVTAVESVSWPRLSAVHQLLGPSPYAYVARGPERARRGGFTVHASTRAEAEALHALLQSGDPLVFIWPAERTREGMCDFSPGERVTIRITSEHREDRLLLSLLQDREIPVTWVETKTPEIGEAPAQAPVTHPVQSGDWIQRATNWMVNPSFEFGGAPVGVRRSLTLNPRGVAGGSTVEVNPRYGWAQTWLTGTTAPFPDGPTTAARLTCQTPQTAAGFDWAGNADAASPGSTGAWLTYGVTAGYPITVSAWVRSNRSMTGYIFVRFHNGAGAWVGAKVAAPGVSVFAGTWTLLTMTLAVPAGATYFVAGTQTGNLSAVAGDVWDQTALYISDRPGYFDYLYTTDPDLTPTAVGAPGNSPSVVTGIRPTNVNSTYAHLIRSTIWKKSGNYSCRMIPIQASRDTWMGQSIPDQGSLRSAGRSIGTIHLEAPQSSPGSIARCLAALSPLVRSDAAPNVPGDTDLELTWDTEKVTALWYCGDNILGGEVFWDEAGIFDASWTGPWFSGDILPEGYDSETWRVSWADVPHASPSILEELVFT